MAMKTQFQKCGEMHNEIPGATGDFSRPGQSSVTRISAMEIEPKKGSRKHGKYGRQRVDALLEFYCTEKQEKKRMKAANTIQRAWRRWLDIGVFDYYKELIGFKLCGEPSHLMKYIEPREAEFLDAAAGVHMKFRLGGIKFPPSIYYKIFTHRPIVDVCAYSPKDYAKLAITTRQTRKLQKKSCEDPSDWYKRIENNGWRLLSPRFWKALDPITAEDNIRVKKFECLSILKKQEMIKQRKRRKIEWLKKMYFGKSLQVQTADPAATVLIQRATEGLIGTLENEGIDKVMEWEVDEMLKWTNALNYEEYVKQWKEIGTSKLSDSYQGFRFADQSYELSDLAQLPHVLHEIVRSHMSKVQAKN